jgi:hypothetical protein
MRACGPLTKTFPCIKLFFVPSDPRDEDTNNCMLFFHQPFLISVDSWLTSWVSLEMQTQVPPWLSLSSSGMAESYSSLFVIGMLVVLMAEEGTSLVFAWKLHLQRLKVVFMRPWLFMALWDTVDRPPLITDVCWYEDACQDVVAFVILLLAIDVQAGLFKGEESRHILANTRWVTSCSSAP